MEILGAIVLLIVANAQYLVGFILPPLVEYLNKDVPSDSVRFIITCVVCFLAALLIDWNQVQSGVGNRVGDSQLAFTALLLFGESQTIFKLYFQQSWLRQKIQNAIGSANAQQLG